jgi:DNA phosphorothioation-associated putative methyltransferase
VINVIDDADERQRTAHEAWELAQRLLVVSARLVGEANELVAPRPYRDGYLTSRGTFQKFYEQQELKHWIDQTLGVSAVPAAPGIFYVFRDEAERSAFLASRFRRRLVAPRLTPSAALYEEHELLLQPLMAFVTERGRVPQVGELAEGARLVELFGSVRRAFAVVERVTDRGRWAAIAEERRQDLLVYLALARFDGRPRFAELGAVLQGDIKGLAGSYARACRSADELLLSIGRPELIDAACRESPVGKLTPSALYVHESALEALPVPLRLFEGCARGYLGRVEGANIVKLHRTEPKVSYLSYPDFDADPHPALAEALTVNLRTFSLRVRRYAQYRNPPILHRKEAFLAADHPLRAKFARLTRLEEAKGLYADSARIGTRDGWAAVLDAAGVACKGHRLVRAARVGA